jgi:hypothetical protein
MVELIPFAEKMQNFFSQTHQSIMNLLFYSKYDKNGNLAPSKWMCGGLGTVISISFGLILYTTHIYMYMMKTFNAIRGLLLLALVKVVFQVYEMCTFYNQNSNF